MHKISMHILLEHLCIDEIFTAKLVYLLATHEFVLIIDDFAMLLFQLFSDIINIRNPFRARS